MKLAVEITIAVLGVGSVLWELTHKKNVRYVVMMILYFIVLGVIVGALS